MFESTALLSYDENQDILRAEVNNDFCKYYKYLFYYETNFTRKMWEARYGGHITIYNPQFHHPIEGAAEFNNQLIKFFYDPQAIYSGGFSKGFEGYYLPIISPDIEAIKEKLKIIEIEPENSFGKKSLHLSLFNNKILKRK